MIVQKTSKIAFMSLGVVINIVLAQVPMHLKLPFFLDVIGTIVISALAGPWIGALTGLVTNFVLGLQNPIWIPYALVQISIGLSVGFLAQKGAFKSYGGLALVAFVVWLVSQLTAIPITIVIFGGTSGSGSSFITLYLLAVGQRLWEAVLTTTLITESVDKIISVIIAYGLIHALPQRLRSQTPLGHLYSQHND